MQRVHFQKVNGFSNNYYGWGAEDDDMYNRIRDVGLSFIRFDPRIATYVMLPHHSSRPEQMNKVDPHFIAHQKASSGQDGLSSLSYQVVDHQAKRLYTWLLVSC